MQQHGAACMSSGTGPIRRVPSAADTTRVSSFPGGTGGHYTPYGSVFAAVTAQHAAGGPAVSESSIPDHQQQQQQHQQQEQHFISRRPPLRQHSYDTDMMQQQRKQQQQQRLAHSQHCAHVLAAPQASHIADHPVNCTSDGCAASEQQWLHAHHHHRRQQQQQHGHVAAAAGACGTYCSADYARGFLQPHRLAPMLSGPPSFGTDPADPAAAAAAAGGEPAGVRAFSFTGPYHHTHSCGHPVTASHQHHHHHQQQQQHALTHSSEAACAAHWHRHHQQHQQQQALHSQLQHQQLQWSFSGEHAPTLTPMHSAPAGGYAHTPLEHTAAAAAAAAVPSAAGATAAALMSLHQIPSGLAAIRPRPQATACIAHTAREHRGWPGESDSAHHAASAARAAAAAAAGRDMVSTQALQHYHRQPPQQQQLSSEPNAEPYKQPQLRQPELQLLLQHQLRQLVPGAGCGPPAAATAADGNIDLQNPAILLELLRHSGMCKVAEDACALGWRCTWVKRLWIHMHTCPSDTCASVHCRLGKQVLPHYKECSDQACATCARVRSYDKALEELRTLTARAVSTAGESVDSPGTNDNSPSTVYIAGEDDDAVAAAAGRGGCVGAAAAMSPALSVTSKPVWEAQRDEEVDQDVYRRQRYFPESW